MPFVINLLALFCYLTKYLITHRIFSQKQKQQRQSFFSIYSLEGFFVMQQIRKIFPCFNKIYLCNIKKKSVIKLHCNILHVAHHACFQNK